MEPKDFIALMDKYAGGLTAKVSKLVMAACAEGACNAVNGTVQIAASQEMQAQGALARVTQGKGGVGKA